MCNKTEYTKITGTQYSSIYLLPFCLFMNTNTRTQDVSSIGSTCPNDYRRHKTIKALYIFGLGLIFHCH